MALMSRLKTAEESINKLAAKDMTFVMDSKKHVESMMVDFAELNKTIAKNGVELSKSAPKSSRTSLWRFLPCNFRI